MAIPCRQDAVVFDQLANHLCYKKYLRADLKRARFRGIHTA